MRRSIWDTGGGNSLFQLVLLVLAIGIVAVLAYRQVQRLGMAKRPVVIASMDLAAGTEIEGKHLDVVRMRSTDVPPSALRSSSAAKGQKLLRTKASGEPLVAEDFARAPGRRASPLSEIIPEGRVLTSLTLENLTVPHQDLFRGDRVDILVAVGSPGTSRRARVVASDAYVVGYLSSPSRAQSRAPQNILGIDLVDPRGNDQPDYAALLLALQPEDVLPVAEVDGSGSHISLVLHSKDTVERGEMLSISSPHSRNRTIEVITGTKRAEVTIP